MQPIEINLLDPKWGGFSAWLETLCYGNELATPARFLWVDYMYFCGEEGFPKGTTREFICWLKEIDGLFVKEGGSGRIRRMIIGCAPDRR